MAESSIDFDLTDGEKTHPLWRRLSAHFAALLENARIRNDRVGMSEQETAALRGRISTLKEIMRLGDDKPIIPSE